MPNIGTLGWAYVSGSTLAHTSPTTDQQVLFYSGSTAISGSNNLKYDYANNQLYLSGNLDISGTLSAYKFETITVSNTTYQGQTKFGNDVNDIHQFTGSIALDGDIELAPSVISTAHITSAGSLTMRADANMTIGDSTVDSIRLGRTNTTAAKIHLRSGADTDLVVSNSKVGIGTASPLDTLSVTGSLGVSGLITAYGGVAHPTIIKESTTVPAGFNVALMSPLTIDQGTTYQIAESSNVKITQELKKTFLMFKSN